MENYKAKMAAKTGMNNPKGMCSSPGNPLQPARRTSRMCGPGPNADQHRANKNLQKAHEQWDSLRGMSGT
jgi:hypothetical protein